MVQRLWSWLVLAVLVSVGCQHTAVADDDVEVIRILTEDEGISDDDRFDESLDHPLCQSFSSDECTETDVKTHCPSLCEHPLCKFYSSDECTETDVKTYCPSLCDSTPPTSNETAFPTTPYGVRFNGPDRLIVGGRNVSQPTHHPWMALLLRRHNGVHFCGGVLITDRHVLTAAHCVYGHEQSEVIVRLGEYNTRRWSKNEKNYAVSNWKIHDDYNKEWPYEHDVAVVIIDDKAPYTNAIRPIALPPTGLNYANNNAFATGWGRIVNYKGGQWAHILQQVNLAIWPYQRCNSFLSGFYDKSAYDLDKGWLCAGSEGGGRTCKGDSGGPLILEIRSEHHKKYFWTVVGIVSWGYENWCGKSKYPSVFTRVDTYLDWINRIIATYSGK